MGFVDYEVDGHVAVITINPVSYTHLETTIDGHIVLAGNGRLMKSKNIPYQECDGIGTVIYLAKDGKFAGSILIADTIKPETEDAIRGLKAAGILSLIHI